MSCRGRPCLGGRSWSSSSWSWFFSSSSLLVGCDVRFVIVVAAAVVVGSGSAGDGVVRGCLTIVSFLLSSS